MESRSIFDRIAYGISLLLFGFAGLSVTNQLAFRSLVWFHLPPGNLIAAGLIAVVSAGSSIFALYRLALFKRLQSIPEEGPFLSRAGVKFCELSLLTGAVIGILVTAVALMIAWLFLAFRQ